MGLAPAAHGGNRTGRMFTGDRSGDFLYAALHRAGFANQPTSVRRGDGLALADAFITAPCRCAPPANKPLPAELVRCSAWLDREVALLPRVRVVLALGSIGWAAALAHFARRGLAVPRPRPQFGHGAVATIPGGPSLLGCYHVSQQNTNTGKLTAAMIDEVLRRAKELLVSDASSPVQLDGARRPPGASPAAPSRIARSARAAHRT
jgi:uracil-DNA glycosylase